MTLRYRTAIKTRGNMAQCGFVVPEYVKQRYEKAANEAGVSLSEWIRRALERELERVAQDEGADDEAIAEIVRERDANDTGERLTLEELAESVGLDVPQDEGKP